MVRNKKFHPLVDKHEGVGNANIAHEISRQLDIAIHILK